MNQITSTKGVFTKLLVLLLMSLSIFVTSCGEESSSNTSSDDGGNNNHSDCPTDPARCEIRNQ